MEILNFAVSNRKGKKYLVNFVHKGEIHTVHFGSKNHLHFRDSTPIKAYSHLNHYNPIKRDQFFRRFAGQKINDPLSGIYWSARYLW